MAASLRGREPGNRGSSAHEDVTKQRREARDGGHEYFCDSYL
jgi:hypothetical protein